MLSIVICTYNRAFILPDCLESLVSQHTQETPFELIVVDNNSSDHTRQLVKSYQTTYPFIKYVIEPKQGLSFARNTGFRVATGKWIGYIDDDAKARMDLISIVFDIIQNNKEFDAFGGMYYPWYKYGKPRWLPDTFGKKVPLSEKRQVVNEGFLSGGIIFVPKKILQNLGGFNTRLGMNKKPGYGEETELQIRMRDLGYKIGFDPNLIIDHCVMPHKLNASWHLKEAFVRGRDSLSNNNYHLNKIILILIRLSITSIFFHLPKNIAKLIFQQTYYKENLIIETFTPLLIYTGRLSGYFKYSKADY